MRSRDFERPVIRLVLRSELLNDGVKFGHGISRTLGNLAILFACLPRSIYILPSTLGASSAHTLLHISQSGDTRSICTEEYELLQPYWNPTTDSVRASNRTPRETWFQRIRDTAVFYGSSIRQPSGLRTTVETFIGWSFNSCTLTVARLDYFDLGQIPREEGHGAGRSLSDTVVVQDSPEVVNRVQLDYPAIQSASGTTRWKYAGFEVVSAFSAGH